MTLHPSAERGFDSAADAYERARPGYPSEAVAWLCGRLGLTPRSTVVDLAAGTGKLTRMLLRTGARVIAVEPVDGMRAKLADALPSVEALPGVAENLPLPDRSADAITVAQAFHWFATDEALAEMARVLRPRGALGLIWNLREQRDPLQRAITELIRPLQGDEPTTYDGRWRTVLERSPLFGPLDEACFRNEQELDANGLAERIASISFVAAAREEERSTVVERARALAGDRIVRLPYVTAALVYRSLRD
ncbi:MAG: class I SAM-dependent methyltransferase [Actinomycetota bacterium]|nr:class I SAM-dependent methyltransferase [Actinomycetota bacterium]